MVFALAWRTTAEGVCDLLVSTFVVWYWLFVVKVRQVCTSSLRLYQLKLFVLSVSLCTNAGCQPNMFVLSMGSVCHLFVKIDSRPLRRSRDVPVKRSVPLVAPCLLRRLEFFLAGRQ